MKRKRFSEEQIIQVLQEHIAGMAVKDLIQKHGISMYFLCIFRNLHHIEV